MADITNYHGDPYDLMNEGHSGLLTYLFGKDGNNSFNKEAFMKLQEDLMDDILWLEFSRYSKDGQTITDLDLCNHLLLCANLTTKHKRQMVSRPSLFQFLTPFL